MVSATVVKRGWRDAENAMKMLCKHRIARIANGSGDGGNGVVFVNRQISCHGNAKLVEILAKALSKGLLELPAKIALVKMQM